MLSFYPGPSKVHPEVLGFIQEAFDSGIVSINHRSDRFEKLLKDTLEILHLQWNIPTDYTLYFISSATEGWEIVSQSLVDKNSTHIYNGAFGKKWAHYAKQINPRVESIEFGLEESLQKVGQATDLSASDTLCLVQSETSNGTGQQILRSDYNLQNEAIIAVDATSSMGGINLPWHEADVWLASVQKCMGIPAGLGILICSPKAIQRAEKLNRKGHYNDVLLMEENRKLFQTHYTPNVLGIYLVNRLAHFLPNLTTIDLQTREKMVVWEEFWKNQKELKITFLVKDNKLRLPTVLALQGEPQEIKKLHQIGIENSIELGKGYGAWKDNSVRIANFPSHTLKDIEFLIHCIQTKYGH